MRGEKFRMKDVINHVERKVDLSPFDPLNPVDLNDSIE